ncbi:hypothetical protein CCP3SC15_1390003 [Gammaproteobacteria bacterium]
MSSRKQTVGLVAWMRRLRSPKGRNSAVPLGRMAGMPL